MKSYWGFNGLGCRVLVWAEVGWEFAAPEFGPTAGKGGSKDWGSRFLL